MKTQALADDVVTQWRGKPHRRVVIGQRQQHAGGGDIQRLPAAFELMQGDNHARLAHGL